MSIVKSILPLQSLLNIENKTYDFIDSYSGEVIDEDNSISSQKLGKSFFTSSPQWVENLMVVRRY
jgi:hypothetical protein